MFRKMAALCRDQSDICTSRPAHHSPFVSSFLDDTDFVISFSCSCNFLIEVIYPLIVALEATIIIIIKKQDFESDWQCSMYRESNE